MAEMNDITSGESEDLKTAPPEHLLNVVSTNNPTAASTIEFLAHEELFPLTPETWIGHPSSSTGNMLEQLVEGEIDLSFSSESETPSPDALLENDSRSSSSIAGIRTIKAIPLNEFDIFGKFVASELSHMPNIYTARCLKAKLQMLLASSLSHLQNEMQSQTIQVVPQK